MIGRRCRMFVPVRIVVMGVKAAVGFARYQLYRQNLRMPVRQSRACRRYSDTEST